MVIHTKLYGLKRIREIVNRVNKETPGLVAFSTFKVYRRPEQFRESHAGNAQRLLIRTDEVGARHTRTTWSNLPRGEIVRAPGNEIQFNGMITSFGPFHTDKVQEVMRRLVNPKDPQMHDTWLSPWNKTHRVTSEPLPFVQQIVHPTRLREDKYGDGELKTYVDSKGRCMIQFGYDHKIQEERNPHASVAFFEWKNGTLTPVDSAEDWSKNTESSRIDETHRELLNRVKKFAEVGVRTGQIKIQKDGYTWIRFLTWKDDPHKPEFYDLHYTSPNKTKA